jgi:acetate---CoA ligase (ADP-forming)
MNRLAVETRAVPQVGADHDGAGLGALLDPASLAVIGASDDPNRIGGLVLKLALAAGFDGPVYPVNPNRPKVQGLAAFPDIAEVPGHVDLAVIAVPSAHVRAAVEGCAARSVRGVVILSAGFGETGRAEDRAEQDRIVAIARGAGMRLLGPNCAGLANFRAGLVASFHPAFHMPGNRAGRVALASQSGAFGGLAHHSAALMGLDLGTIVTTGNEADVRIDEAISHFARAPGIRAILTYVEGIRDGAGFAAALEEARRARRPVVMVKVGESEAGSRAAASHTGALAAGHRVSDGLCRQHGVIRAHALEELFSLGYAFDRSPLPQNDGVLIVTVSGGIGVLLSDETARRGLQVPPLSQEARKAILSMVPNAGVHNPVDVTGQVFSDPDLFAKVLGRLVDETAFGSLVVQTGITSSVPGFADRIAAVAADVRERRPDMPIHFTGHYSDDLRGKLEAAGVACFTEPVHAVRAIAALREAARGFDRAPSAAPARALSLPPVPEAPAEGDALALVAAAGIPVAAHRVADGPEAIAQAAGEIGFPVALKVHSPKIAHKSDVGGVRLKLTDAAQVRAAATEMREVLQGNGIAPKDTESFLAMRMEAGQAEAILGLQRDPVLGWAVMFGLGGIMAEALEDVTFRTGPITVEEAHRMIREIHAFPLLLPQRGQPGVDLDALAQAIADLSQLGAALGPDVRSVEVNPLLLRADGVLALDALIDLAPQDQD